jgi:monothiol glutaredoxin
MIRQVSSNIWSVLGKSITACNSSRVASTALQTAKLSRSSVRLTRHFSEESSKDSKAPKMDVEGSDADFRPQEKAASKELSDAEILSQIDGWVKNNNILLFMKGNPQQPMCGYSRFVVEVLKYYNVSGYKSVDVLKDANVRRLVKEYSDWQTFPQLYIKGEMVGGCDIVTEMHKKGTLHDVLEQAKK